MHNPGASAAFGGRLRFVLGSQNELKTLATEPPPVTSVMRHPVTKLREAIRGTTGANTRYTGTELPSLVSSVRLYDVLKHQWPLYELGSAGSMLALPHARTADDEPYSFRDIAAFRIEAPGLLKIAEFAEEDPKPGDPVWLAAAMPDGSRTRRATCVERTDRTFIFRYDEAKELPPHSSGAPIIDSDGAVVGINTGLGRYDGRDFGHANPLSSIRAHLESAL